MMLRPWHSREYKEGDEQNILDLHKLVFGSEVNIEWWTWQYEQNPAGQGVIVVAESDQGIVGQYALVPRLVRIDDSTCLSGLSLDTMVHPDYRGQGMFIALTKQVYELAAQRGIHFVYGFPNENSHHGFITRLNWVDLYNGIPLWAKPLNLESILRKRFVDNKLLARLGNHVGNIAMSMLHRSQGSSRVCSVKEVSSFDLRFDSLWDGACRNHRIAVVRDKAYLAWRYIEKPDSDYSILIAERAGDLLGYVVLRCMDHDRLRIGFIVDILSRSNGIETPRDLISAAIEYFESKQMDVAGCLMLPNACYSQNLKQAGFIKIPKRLLPQEIYLGTRGVTSRYPMTFLADMNNWFITWGDHDAI